MNSVIYDPVHEFETKYRKLHLEKTKACFESLVKQSGVDVNANHKAVRQYDECASNRSKLKKQLNWLRFWRVMMCISIILIPLVVIKITPKIKALREEVGESDVRARKAFEEAKRQMQPLVSLFAETDSIRLIESTLPILKFNDTFTAYQELDMRLNYDFGSSTDHDQSALEVLSGTYNDNPFLFEKKVIHRMGTETYHGYKTIYWTERCRDQNGKWHTESKSQTLEATVTKPKPFYDEQFLLNYCAQGGPDLSFSRDASHVERKSEKELERYVKRGEKRLKKKTDDAVKHNSDFVSMSNSEFEVLFDALDRTDEVQFRTLFTPLAQTNIVALLASQSGYGDDFCFIKNKRTNKIISEHSRYRGVRLRPEDYDSHSFDQIKANFIGKNAEYFKAVYFDFAPVLSIPIYQERPSHSLKPLPSCKQLYSFKEYEVLANSADIKLFIHPDTDTRAIMNSMFVNSDDGVDEIKITAYSYKILKRVEEVSVYGDDGRFHDVPVEWDEYIPIEAVDSFFVSNVEKAENKTVIAGRDGLCIFKS